MIPLLIRLLGSVIALVLTACSSSPLRGTGDLGLIVERAQGRVVVVDSSARTLLGRIDGLGDLSHASVVFSRDGRYGYVFGRDGGLSKVDLLTQQVVKRVLQAGNSIGGAISQDGRLVVAQNYQPGGIKAFDAETLALVAEVPASYGDGSKRSKVVGLADLTHHRFAYSLFDAGEIRITDFSDPQAPQTQSFPAGQQPYDGLVTPDGRYYLAGLFGEDGLTLVDTWQPERGSQPILQHYGRGQEKLPVFKMPHLRGWAIAGHRAYLPAVGHHELLVVDTTTWQEVGRIPLKGQPVFAIARPDGRQVWINFAFPDNGFVQVLDTLTGQIVATLAPGKGVLHLEFTPRGEAVWISARDDNRVVVYDTTSLEPIQTLTVDNPSGIFFTHRAGRQGF